jgi:hypothetical protein
MSSPDEIGNDSRPAPWARLATPARALLLTGVAALGVHKMSTQLEIAPFNSEPTPAMAAETSHFSMVSETDQTPQAISISVDTAHPGPPIPEDFIGLSYEAKDLPMVASMAERGNFVSLLQSLGKGVLRFGGMTGDSQVAWENSPTTQRPAWATTELTPDDLYRLKPLTQKTGWKVLLAVNLAHYDPVAAADEARVAKAALGPDLKAIAIGNEPTAFAAEHLVKGKYPFSRYLNEIRTYRRAIEASAPGVPIVGPDNEPPASNRRNQAWTRGIAQHARPELLTGHLYGASSCSSAPPTAATILTPKVHHEEQTALNQLAKTSRDYGIPAWLDETNNISCGGQAGVSDTYATALWATDLLTRTLKPPFTGAVFHGFLQKPESYSPIAALSSAELDQGNLTARPEWYSLLLAHQVEGDRPLPVTMSPAGHNVSVWAGQTPEGGLQLLVDNEEGKSARPVQIDLKDLPSNKPTSILRLTGPSLMATSGVELGNSIVASDGSWQPVPSQPQAETASASGEIVIPPLSAALITTTP